MRKKFYTAALLALLPFGSLFSKSIDSAKKVLSVNQYDIDIVYSHYIQDGNNSAVTGGIGTEKLVVYSPYISFKTKGKKSYFGAKAGSDIISSASTDNIDFVQSSASRLDARTHANINAGNYIKALKSNFEVGTGFSIESDYLSKNFTVGWNKESRNKMRNLSFESKIYLDDLRWGRLNSNYKKPVKLIYPSELRGNNWFDIYKRNSYNFKFGVSQIVNKRNIIGLFPLVVLQNGLLSTPFHRVVFADSSRKVENLPNQRTKLSVVLKWNKFVGGSTIIKTSVELYKDNFHINGFAIENETTFKLKSGINISPFLRLYSQTASIYFAPYAQHQLNEIYYSSDYDLSKFQTVKSGIEFKWLCDKKISNHSKLKNMALRYAYFYRTNGLFAHIMTLNIQIGN